MSLINRLSFGFSRKLPVLLQTEASECGLACLGMLLGYFGKHVDMHELRRDFSVSLKGATLNNLVKISRSSGLVTRPVKIEIESLGELRLPCLLHWNMNHFVVLKEVKKRGLIIHDPATGPVKISHKAASASFTGIAMEVWPSFDFKIQAKVPSISMRSLMGQVVGVKRALTQLIILALTLQVIGMTAPFFLQLVIDNVIPSGDQDLLKILAVAFAVLLVAQQILQFLKSYVGVYFGTTLNLQWRENVFSHLLRLPMQFFEKRHIGDVVSRFNSIDQIQKVLTTSILSFVLDGISAVLALSLMILYNAKLAFVGILAMVLYGLGRFIWYTPLKEAAREQIIHSAKFQSHFLETIRGIRTIKLFQKEEERRQIWLSGVINQTNSDLKMQKLIMFYEMLNGALFGAENIISIWIGANSVLSGDFSVGMLSAYLAYKAQFVFRINALIDRYFDLKMLKLHGERLSDIVLHPPEQATENLLDVEKPEPTLTLTNVSFRYSDHEPFVLKNISLTIRSGESVAIIGPSGCGKSTLLNIIIGSLYPTSGNISMGDMLLSPAELPILRSMIATVLQDDVLFAGSIAENICFFDPEMDFERVVECSVLAAISDEISKMPMKYQTLVGDMGTVLSGGQKQRILLARALYRKPSILVLDEATSHLDIQREAEVNRAIKSLKITRIIVAHREETILSADRVLKFEDGSLISDAENSIAENSCTATQ
ncbi:peptidase domain-containing ABC transporter [Duganella violaceipulchra]|uniref:Cyclolysin secretion/processing ATP-binding protein CyaB n=1 Tax=Duganella violaceipulchra TaxID=2849652 RepID=A0AA41L2F4_9BURK|nr:peptidase domain-containing ABC transporter [Duganella violaceicalia]MBV6320214.1 peptidase domain-containing ABC transporter [Duganella violaceicalia]MCP2011662.1 ATP-binding cassette subfamily B protein RaxB [Duganella violaceicalia]